MASNLSALKPVQQQQQLAYWRCRTRLLQATHTAQRTAELIKPQRGRIALRLPLALQRRCVGSERCAQPSAANQRRTQRCAQPRKNGDPRAATLGAS